MKLLSFEIDVICRYLKLSTEQRKAVLKAYHNDPKISGPLLSALRECSKY